MGASFTDIISKVTDALFELLIPLLLTNEMEPALTPYKFEEGWNLAKSRAVFMFAKVPAAVKLSDPFPSPPKVIPEVPSVNVPPVTVKVTV